MDGKVIQITLFHLRPGCEELLLPDLTPLIEASRQFSGCLAFDLYRLSKQPDMIVLQETWETHDAYQGYSLGPLKGEFTGLLARSLAQPMETWQVEEVCLHSSSGL